MKCLFIYFSSTGITAKLAREIAKGINSKEEVKIDFVRIKKGMKIDPSSYDLFGFGAPSYSFHAPRMATNIIRKIDFQMKPFFVFASYNTMVGNTNWSLYRAVKPTAGTCLGHFKTSVTVNIRAWKPKKSSNKKMKEFSHSLCIKANEFGEAIYDRYNNLLQQKIIHKQNRNWKPPKKLLLLLWNLLLTWNWQMRIFLGYKRVDLIKCNRCGLCASKICPSKAIQLTKENIPKFSELKCISCNGCVNLCPQDAIWSNQTKNRQPYNLYKDYILKEDSNNK